MKQMSRFRLYNYCFSSASWRVRIVLNLKNIRYEYTPINIVQPQGEQLTPEYAKINPMNQVPALEVDGTIITESMPICEYLEESVPQPPLLPSDPIKKAQVRAFCEMINAGTQPLTTIGVLKALEKREVDTQEWAQYWLQRRFSAFEKYLEDSKGRYCFGDNITLGDAFLLPMVQGTVKRFDINMEKFPVISGIVENLKEIEEFRDAHPLNQIDAPAPKSESKPKSS